MLALLNPQGSKCGEIRSWPQAYRSQPQGGEDEDMKRSRGVGLTVIRRSRPARHADVED